MTSPDYTALINLPPVLAEVEAVFAKYEQALVGNDVAVLDELFWVSPHTLRYGAGENLYGYDAIQAFRKGRPANNLAREITAKAITTFGNDFAVANVEFRRAGSERIGRQSQTWVRMPQGWRVVSAHVSVIGRVGRAAHERKRAAQVTNPSTSHPTATTPPSAR